MHIHLLSAALAAAVPASAQVVFDASELARVRDGVKSLRERLTPAAVDPKPVAVLFERLAKDGETIESETGMKNVYQRLGAFDVRGKMRDLEVALMESPAPADLEDAPMARHAVYRRYFSRLEARNEDYRLKADGSVRVDAWDWVVSLDGRLLSVAHTVVPVEGEARAYRMSPSDPAVQRRWNRVVKDLLTLGRAVSI